MVAGGAGERFGRPKQFELLGDERVVDLAVAGARAACDAVVLVLPSGPTAHMAAGRGADADAADVVVTGGASRSQSVRSGLAAVPADVEVILVHDAARPLATPELYRSVIAAVQEGADAAVPGVPVPDTLKAVRDGVVRATVERDGLVAVQTPQAFRAAVLRAAHAGEPVASDDAALVEANGGKVRVVPGHPRTFKITTPADLDLARILVRDAAE